MSVRPKGPSSLPPSGLNKAELICQRSASSGASLPLCSCLVSPPKDRNLSNVSGKRLTTRVYVCLPCLARWPSSSTLHRLQRNKEGPAEAQGCSNSLWAQSVRFPEPPMNPCILFAYCCRLRTHEAFFHPVQTADAPFRYFSVSTPRQWSNADRQRQTKKKDAASLTMLPQEHSVWGKKAFTDFINSKDA